MSEEGIYMDLKVAAYWRELEGDCAHADEINRNNLLGLIRDNKDTVFGNACAARCAALGIAATPENGKLFLREHGLNAMPYL